MTAQPSDAELVDRFRSLWDSSHPPDIFEFLDALPDLNRATRLQIVLTDQFQRWSRRQAIPAEDYIQRCSRNGGVDDDFRFAVIAEELGYLEEREGQVDGDQFLERFRPLSSEDLLHRLKAELALPLSSQEPKPRRSESKPNRIPEQIGRYRVTRNLGQGAFGIVYLADDPELRRAVAIKVPTADRIARVGGVDAFLTEARAVANLEHESIVPVYDVGHTEDGICYVVSRFIDGCDLGAKFRSGTSSIEVARIVATIARAAHHAHRSGLIHRDIKPANILLDKDGRPFLLDFGLALKDEDFGTGSDFVGTPAWMSPEQARGEGHRVDARSDVYSLGVILFEGLTGKRPYRASSTDEMLHQIRTGEVRPPRQLDDSIPRALDRICLKALARRASERYSTALDLAEELDAFIAERSDDASSESSRRSRSDSVNSTEPTSRSESGQASASDRIVPIVPKGLRSFDASDADFFLQLLPGPRDRVGIPDGLRFWLSRIHETEDPFAVGLLYGPSGCGKSSLVKAGLLPRLEGNIETIYLEATASTTEERLLKAVCRRRPQCTGLSLAHALTELRRAAGASGEKLLIVIDQFEQWLHAWDEDEPAGLVAALRQCDGRAVQALVMVRDDFWMAATRFFREIEVPLLERRNSVAVDLFSKRHARKVLRAFGAAFESIPGNSQAAEAFVREAVESLADHDRISPVRLVLFAEMVKSRDWSSTTLRQTGGPAGIGAAFLDECFGPQAPVSRRTYARAAEDLLASLLPVPGADIRGASRNAVDLRKASGLSEPDDFDSLLHMLDQQLRLVTPADARALSTTHADSSEESARTRSTGDREPRFQLTHDYLVPSIRQWVAQRRNMTVRGRMKNSLALRSEQWSRLPERRLLPAWWEDIGFRIFTRSREWTDPQRRMMQRSGRRVSLMFAGAVAAIAFAVFAARDLVGRSRGRSLRNRILNANTAELPAILREARDYRPYLIPLLEIPDMSLSAATTHESRRRELHRQLACFRLGGTRSAALYESIMRSRAADFESVNTILEQSPALPEEPFWSVLYDDDEATPRQLRAAAVLARRVPEHADWERVAADVVELLTESDPLESDVWIHQFEPIGQYLTGGLASRLGNGTEQVARRTIARALAAYTTDLSELARLAVNSSAVEFAEIAPKVVELGPDVLPVLQARLQQEPAGGSKQNQARLQANVAALRLQLGETADLQLFEAGPDPTVRSYLIHHYGVAGGKADVLVQAISQATTPSARAGFLLALGEVARENYSNSEFAAVGQIATRLFRTDPDPGVHSAAEWLLRRRHMHDVIDRVKADLARTSNASRRWHVTSSGLTMIRIDGPFDLRLGSSPEVDPERFSNEARVVRHCGRSLIISSTEITAALFKQFLADNPDAVVTDARLPVESDQSPQIAVTWYMGAWFCNWLSQREGIPQSEWAYLPNADGKYVYGMYLADKPLLKRGYRMPTHYEWEYVARAGTTTSRYYGHGTELLPHYAWYAGNSRSIGHDVGQLKPNPWGLFDILGNAYEWCTCGGSMTNEMQPLQKPLKVSRGRPRRVRGGNLLEQARYHRATRRSYHGVTAEGLNLGLRVVRTIDVHDTKDPVVKNVEGWDDLEPLD